MRQHLVSCDSMVRFGRSFLSFGFYSWCADHKLIIQLSFMNILHQELSRLDGEMSWTNSSQFSGAVGKSSIVNFIVTMSRSREILRRLSSNQDYQYEGLFRSERKSFLGKTKRFMFFRILLNLSAWKPKSRNAVKITKSAQFGSFSHLSRPRRSDLEVFRIECASQ
jgi:hypothetical protein